MKAEMGGCCFKPRDLRLPETTRSWERPGPASPSQPSAGSDPADTLISNFQPPEP